MSKHKAIALLVVEPEQRLLAAFCLNGMHKATLAITYIENKLLPGLKLSVDPIWSKAQLWHLHFGEVFTWAW